MKKGTIIAAARHMVQLFYKGGEFQKSGYFTGNMICNVPQVSGRTIENITHYNDYVCFHKEGAVMVTGKYHLLYITGNGRKAEAFCWYTALFEIVQNVTKLTALLISESQGKVLCLTDVMERTYYLPETDVLYLECGHNRVYWHTTREILEVTGTLSDMEKSLSDRFVRIHRSFIVNAQQVSQIARCHVELTNGEQLQIPVKKYIEIKEKLKRTKEAEEAEWIQIPCKCRK